MDPSAAEPCGSFYPAHNAVACSPTCTNLRGNQNRDVASGESEKSPSHFQGKDFRGWRRIVRNFTPSWFSVNMGTGIVSILLHNLPYNGNWLYWISIILFCLNIFLFLLFLGISILRYTLYPYIWAAMIRHPAQSLFLGTFPMGLATIINMVVFVCVPAFGGWAIELVSGFFLYRTSSIL